MNINLHIDRLVLDGGNIPPGQHHQLKANVQAELSRLLAKGGVSPSLANGTTVPTVSAPSIQMGSGKGWKGGKAPGNETAQLARQIALSIYGGIGK